MFPILSFLKRAIKTLTTILQENGMELKFNTSWEINERHYGSLTGLNKEETKKKKLEKNNIKNIEDLGIFLHHQCLRKIKINLYLAL